MADRDGFVYILSNPAMPGALKIGHTRRDPIIRLKELNSATGVPMPFRIEGAVKSSDAEETERMLHAMLADRRLNRKREFFRVDRREALKLAKQAAAKTRSRFIPGRRFKSAMPTRPGFVPAVLGCVAVASWLIALENPVLAVAWCCACLLSLVTGSPKMLSEFLELPDFAGWISRTATVASAAAAAATAPEAMQSTAGWLAAALSRFPTWV